MRLLPFLLHFETTPDGGEGGGGEPPAPAPPDGGGEQAAWSGPSQEEWSQVTDTLGWLNEQRQAYEQNQGYEYGESPDYSQGSDYTQMPQQSQQELQIPDPTLDPAAFAQWLDQRDQQVWEQRQQSLAPLYQQTSQQMIQQGMESLPSDLQIWSNVPEEHQAPAQTLLKAVAAGIIAPGDQNPDIGGAIRVAAENMKPLLEAVRQAGYEEGRNWTQNAGSDQIREPGINGAGVEAVEIPRSYDEIVERASAGTL